MGHDRPLFELIIEESRSKARPRPSAARDDATSPRNLKLPKLAGWFTAKKFPDFHPQHKPSPSPTKCTTSDYESANDTFSSNSSSPIEKCPQGHVVGLPCLQDDGERYLEVAMALDMMELRVAQACAERDVALSQALNLRFAIDSMRNRLHEVEQHCMQLNYQLYMSNTRA